MKSASSGTLASLAAGNVAVIELYKFTLADTTVSAWHDSDYTLPITIGSGLAAATYGRGLLIERGELVQEIGLDPQTLDLTLTPQSDWPTPLTIGGVPFLQACRRGTLDGARLVFSRMILSSFDSLANGATVWWQGRLGSVNANRQSARVQVKGLTSRLNVQMPRNVVQTGCVHTLFDAGCALSKATWTGTANVSATGPNSASSFTTNATSTPDDYYTLGVIKFTSGANAGQSRTVKTQKQTNGVITLIQPLPVAPAVGDAFTISAGCDKAQATCSSKFSNLTHFRGFPYVPVPETLYDGGASVPSTGIDPTSLPGSDFAPLLPNTYQW